MDNSERKQRISHYIRDARLARAMEVRELADLIGVGKSAVYDWENGESLPSLLNLGPLCDALQVDADLFAHPPEIPISPVRQYLREVAERAADFVVDEAREQRPGDAAGVDQRPRATRGKR